MDNVSLDRYSLKTYVNSLTNGRKATTAIVKFRLTLDGETKQFEGIGTAVCDPKDKYDEFFGKTLAYFRAEQDAFKKMETYLVKYSCQVEEPKDKAVKAFMSAISALVGVTY